MVSAAHRAVADEVLEEVEASIEKHGNQDHLPDGVHPHGPNVILDAIGDRTGRALAAYSSTGLADALRARCKAASHEEGDGTLTWEHIASEEWGELTAAPTLLALRTEAIQLAAVMVKWAAAIEARMSPPDDGFVDHFDNGDSRL